MSLLLILSQALAIPFGSEVLIDDFQITLGSQSVLVLPAVVVKTSSPDIAWTSLGGPFYRIGTSSPQDAIHLALELAEDPSIQMVWPDYLNPQKIRYQWNDPLYQGQWYLEFLDMHLLLAETMGDANINLAVIDSGIDISHPDLQNYIWPFDAHSNDFDPSPNTDEFCYGGSGICDEHGTAVAGIMLATADNNEGMVGLCPNCSLIPIKMLGEGSGSLSSDIMAFEHARESDAAVINNSWGYVEPTLVPDILADSIHRAATLPRGGLGALVVFAAGNDNREIQDGELCDLEDVLCISAIDSYGRPTAYTNFGQAVDIAAPSATVSIAPNNESTVTFGGTSAAAPVVSGLAGWALSINPDLSAKELYDLLIDSSIPSPLVTVDENGHHPSYGYGVISATTLQDKLHSQPANNHKETKKTACSTIPLMPFLISLFFWGIIPTNSRIRS